MPKAVVYQARHLIKNLFAPPVAREVARSNEMSLWLVGLRPNDSGEMPVKRVARKSGKDTYHATEREALEAIEDRLEKELA